MQTPQIKTKNFVKNFAFIDSQNVNLAIRNQGWKLDFAKFITYLKDKFKVTKAFIFIGYVAGNESLYTYLQKTGYIIIHKPTFKDKNGEIKGNCDAEMVLQTMIEYENYDKAVIVSGDGDFHCLVEYLESKEKLEKLIIPNRNSYSNLLRKFEKKSTFLSDDNLKRKLEK